MRLHKLVTASVMMIAFFAEAKSVPDLSFKDLQGHTEKLSTLRGQVAVVNFWATFCGPCKEEMPMLSTLATEYSAKAKFIGVSADDNPEGKKTRTKIDAFIAEQKPALEIWTGADLDTLGHLQLGNVLPATIVLDEKGEIVTRIEGQAHQEDVKTALDWVLAGRQGSAPEAVVKRY